MAVFSPAGKAPGVYIEEIPVPGPVPGVSTNVGAFIGPATQGKLFTPTLITSFKQFNNLFGSYIEDPYRVYVTHAVKGFFDEGGTSCWFVRAGTGVAAWLDLLDQSAAKKPVLRVTALQEGKPAPADAINVKVDNVSAGSTKASRPKIAGNLSFVAANKNQIISDKPADGDLFKPGDSVYLEKGANNETNTIYSITKDPASAPTKVIFTMAADLKNDYSGGTLRLADFKPPVPGNPPVPTVIRVDDATGFEAGTYVTLAQGGVKEDVIVKRVDTTSNFVYLSGQVKNLYTMKDGDPDVTLVTREFTLTFTATGKPTETFEKLAMDPRHSRYFATFVQSAMVSIDYTDPPSTTSPAKNVPGAIAATPLDHGANEDLTALTSNHYIQGITALARTTNVNLLCIPDSVGSKMANVADTQAIQAAMVNQCETLQDRFAILDPRPVTNKNNFYPDISQQRLNLNSDNGYGALYFPWIKIASPFDSTQILIPPSGHLAGVFANNDNTRGVGKAPANEPITMALDLEIPLVDSDQGLLNDIGINGIRNFPGEGIRIWGARTITPPENTQWRYVSVRRLLIYIEKSIQGGTRFAVFEPNNPGLWGKVKRLVDDFLTGVWASGALEGVTPDKSFRVRIDTDLNPSSSIALGILTAEITIFPAPPAEFVVFQIIQEPGGSFVSESA